jgi:glycogen operon protein
MSTGYKTDGDHAVLKDAPLGSLWHPEDNGVSFVALSEHASKVQVVLFDEKDNEIRLDMKKGDGDRWSLFVEGIAPGTPYCLAADGVYNPAQGLSYNRHKLFQDPCCPRLDTSRRVANHKNNFGYEWGKDPLSPASISTTPNKDVTYRSIVPELPDDAPRSEKPNIPWNKTVIYEANVRTLTINNESVPEAERATFAGVASDAMIEHYKKLGVTTIQLLPVFEFETEGTHLDKGLENIWGYNTAHFFSPHAAYAKNNPSVDPMIEFRAMVDKLHANGIEVILDVVYNHTMAGNHKGPMDPWKGLDASNAYMREDDPAKYRNYTGTGNTVDCNNRIVLPQIVQSLRHWVEEGGVDGFRFDLAYDLGRTKEGYLTPPPEGLVANKRKKIEELTAGQGLSEKEKGRRAMDWAMSEIHKGRIKPDPYEGFNPNAPIFEAIKNDPILGKVKLIAEPWCASHYQDPGYFPPGWREQKDPYRKTMKDFLLRNESIVAAAGSAIAGSSINFDHPGKKEKPNESGSPSMGISMFAVHDGMTGYDHTAYNWKHNELNGEGNRDGADDNHSNNCGHEGDDNTPDHVLQTRWRKMRNMALALALSQGVPMYLAGDEFGHTQGGNNNAYLKRISDEHAPADLNWERANTPEGRKMMETRVDAARLREENPILTNPAYLHGKHKDRHGVTDISWRDCSGGINREWGNANARCLAVMYNNAAIKMPGDDAPATRLMAVFNAHTDWVSFRLPELAGAEGDWETVANTTLDIRTGDEPPLSSHMAYDTYDLPPDSVVVFRQKVRVESDEARAESSHHATLVPVCELLPA